MFRSGCTLVVILVAILAFSAPSLAQQAEIGAGIGTFNYTGDINRNYRFKYSRPAGTIFYRSNLNRIVSFRTALTVGQLSGEEVPEDAVAVQRGASFNLFLAEVSTGLEYHFLNWRDTKRFVRFTPYLFGGVALFSISGETRNDNEYSSVQAAIPLGVGVKYVHNPKWYFALEFGVRKTFFDYLDGVSDADQRIKNLRYGNPNDNDYYYFLGVSITRTFYSIPCPTNPYR